MTKIEWTPTTGIYRHGTSIVAISRMPDGLLFCATSTRIDLHGLYLSSAPFRDMPVTDWSLLAPDQQPGPPTEAQLARWPWWAMWTDYGMVCGHITMDRHLGWLMCGGVYLSVAGTIRCSAPMQPDWSTGPRWVPLSVCQPTEQEQLAHAGQYLTGEVDSPPPGLPPIPDAPVRPPPCGPACGGKRKCSQCGRRG